MVRVRGVVIAWAHGAVSTTTAAAFASRGCSCVSCAERTLAAPSAAVPQGVSAPPLRAPAARIPLISRSLPPPPIYCTSNDTQHTRKMYPQGTRYKIRISFDIQVTRYIIIIFVYISSLSYLCVYVLCRPNLCTSKIFYCRYFNILMKINVYICVLKVYYEIVYMCLCCDERLAARCCWAPRPRPPSSSRLLLFLVRRAAHTHARRALRRGAAEGECSATLHALRRPGPSPVMHAS